MPSTSPKPDSNDTAMEAIHTLETLLEVFPEDISSLESLTAAYEEMGDKAKFMEKGKRLARLLSKGDDTKPVIKLVDRLLHITPNDPEVLALQEEALAKDILAGMNAPVSDVPHAGGDAGAAGHTVGELTFDLHAELDLAWLLLQKQMITQEQYEASIERLTTSSAAQRGDSPLSLLQELREMDRVNLDKIIAFLASETGMPFLELGRCECDEETVSLLPLPQAKRLGVLPFDRLSTDLMVALLNPVSREWRQRVQMFLGVDKVHFYFTSPDEFLAAIGKVQERRAKSG
jgi:hypothetical protein